MTMKMTGKKFTACIIFIITGLLCTSYSNGQIDPKSIEGVWFFDEASGDITRDSSGHGYDADLKENPEWVEGKFGHALEFQGGSYLEIRDSGANLAFGGSEPFSITAWVKNQGGGTAVGKFNGGIIGAYILVINGDGSVTFHREVAPWTFSGSKTLPDDDFGHVAVTYDGIEMKIYINGEFDAQQDRGSQNTDTATPVLIGARFTNNEPSEFFNGVLDEVALFNVALTIEQIRDVMNGLTSTFIKAFNPDPQNGILHEDTWISLSWSPGDFAASHDVYFGENFDDVSAGTNGAFMGNQSLANFVVGFPGYPFPDGLVPGTTYYWRIDEVNDIHPDSPWAGDVWSFTIPTRIAYNPVPADGAKFLEPDVKLSWSAGFNSILHNIYFGDNFADVDTGTGGTSKGPATTTSYITGGLEPGKAYYWRIDEFDGATTHKGNIWSFTVAGTGGGVRADYYRGMNFENFVLTRTDPQINFNWGDPGGPDPSVGNDNFSVRWIGEVEAVFTETYTFYPRTDDGVRLFVDGQLLVDRWVDRTVAENRGTIDLIAGNTYSLVMEYYENTGGAVAELHWSSPRTPKQLIPQAALALPVKAGSPTPRSGSVDVSQTTVLSWGPGDYATSHEIYLGTDEDAVRNASKTSPEYKGTKALDNESFDPGKMDWDTTYYWRVDEINPSNPDSPWIGNIWSFTTADFLIIDDFEGYDAGENQIWYSWHDGLGYGTPGVDPYFAGNGTGAAVGDETTPSFTEETIVHGGSQSMPLFYDNNKDGYYKYSEAEFKLIGNRDWTEHGITELSLWFYGNPNNSDEPIYVTIANSTGTPAVVYHDEAQVTQKEAWTEWIIPVQIFAGQGVILSDVDTIAIGFGTKGNTAIPGGSGKMCIDDIRLYTQALE